MWGNFSTRRSALMATLTKTCVQDEGRQMWRVQSRSRADELMRRLCLSLLGSLRSCLESFRPFPDYASAFSPALVRAWSSIGLAWLMMIDCLLRPSSSITTSPRSTDHTLQGFEARSQQP